MKKLKTYELPRLSSETFQRSAKTRLVMVLDNIRSMHNVGAAFRIGDAFLLERIYLCGITATPPRAAITKTALGAEKHVDWKYEANTLAAIQHLKALGYVIIAMEQTDSSIPIHAFTPSSTHAYALVFGHEVWGVGSAVVEACDLCSEIPQHGTKHSLNVSVSMGIATWTMHTKLTYS